MRVETIVFREQKSAKHSVGWLISVNIRSLVLRPIPVFDKQDVPIGTVPGGIEDGKSRSHRIRAHLAQELAVISRHRQTQNKWMQAKMTGTMIERSDEQRTMAKRRQEI